MTRKICLRFRNKEITQTYNDKFINENHREKEKRRKQLVNSLQSFVLEILTNQPDDVLIRVTQGNSWCAHFAALFSVSILGGPIRCGPILHATIVIVIGSLHDTVAAAAASATVYTSASGTVSSGFFTRRLSTVVPR